MSEKEEASHQNKFIESIIETANAIILTWEPDTTITSFNTFGKKTFGYTDKDVIGTKWLEFIPLDIRPYMKGVSEKIVTGENLYWDHENAWLCKDGSIKFILWRNSPIKDDKGQIISYISIGVDISERKATEETLKETENKFRTLFEGANDSIFIHDLEGNFVEVNETASQKLGYSKEEFKKMNVRDIVSLEHQAYTSKRIHSISQNKSLFSETVHITKDGVSIPVELSSRKIELNKHPYILCIARDITERKKSEEEMKRQLMKFRLEDGTIYSVREITPTITYEAFKDLQKIGYGSLVISRDTEKEFRNYCPGDYKYIWLHGTANTDDSDIFGIEKYLGNLNRKTVILLDRTDYLISKYGFDITLNFLNNLKDIAYLNGLIILITLDPQLLSDKELKFIEKDTKTIELRHGEALPDDLLDILKYVFSNNKKGIKPSFSDIGIEFNITRPTIKKRINFLVISNYISISTNGPSKVVELTQKGKDLFF